MAQNIELPRALGAILEGIPRAALAFSGGADSAFLLYAALQGGVEVDAYYVDTAFQPAFELRDARRLAAELGARLQVLPHDILADPEVAANPPERCYHCKKGILTRILGAAKQDGHTLLMDGSNASDDAGDRPGMRALGEFGVRSPLREAGLRKADVRRLAKEAGLFTWKKPAYACLATRVPTGTALEDRTLAKIEAAEDALFELGFSDFRCRVQGGAARMQFNEEQLSRAADRWCEIYAALAPHFDEVLLDLKPRPVEAALKEEAHGPG